jgi:hypothetical protein
VFGSSTVAPTRRNGGARPTYNADAEGHQLCDRVRDRREPPLRLLCTPPTSSKREPRHHCRGREIRDTLA